jgi:membrane-associated phospholipid phosphatase
MQRSLHSGLTRLFALVCVMAALVPVHSFAGDAIPAQPTNSQNESPIEIDRDRLTGKPFFHWLWYDQFKPTLREAADVDGFGILLGTTAATIAARQYDFEARKEFGDNNHMPTEISKYGSILGSGWPGGLTTLGLLIWDTPNGLRMFRAMALTSLTAYTIGVAADRRRPNDGLRSFPSGHTSTMFALATSLAYSYGPWAGVPALTLASFVGASRIADNAHWLSDTIAAAGIGVFWARASAQAGLQKGSLTPAWTPAVVPGGVTLNFSREF